MSPHLSISADSTILLHNILIRTIYTTEGSCYMRGNRTFTNKPFQVIYGKFSVKLKETHIECVNQNQQTREVKMQVNG